MPTYSNGNGSADGHICDSHDKRITRLEDGMDKVLVQGTETATKLDFVAARLEEGMADLSGKLEASFEKINERLNKETDQADASDVRITKMEGKEQARMDRASLVKKAVIPLLIAGGSVLATKFGEIIWIWLTR